jgi:hypothetical protein
LSFKKGRVLKALPFLFFKSQQRPIVILEPTGILDLNAFRKDEYLPSKAEGIGGGSLMIFDRRGKNIPYRNPSTPS